MKKLRLSFLWHMHQPYYKDSMDGVFDMPWVYLHATKDYCDMAKHVEAMDGKLKATFNYVPSLVMQMEEYESVDVADSFIILLRKNPDMLGEHERAQLSRQLTMINRRSMSPEFPRLNDILIKLDSGTPITSAELRDASVLYLLAWTGVFWRNEKVPAELIAKGYGFTEDDKHRLLEFNAHMIGTIIPLHKDMAKRGLIEISCTPMFHPILPLLADFSSAKEAMPHAPMPNVGDGFGDDYKWHISAAIDYHTETFGSRPMGSWPSEGSVSPLAADEYINNGFRWIASDEDILARTLERGIKEYPARKELYKQYYREKDGRRINIYFRDKALSDLIGFTYSTWNADAAVDDFLGKLREIYDNCDFSPHVSVILDGENAWEYYHKNASVFFEKLYKKITETDWIVTQTMSTAADEIYDTPLLKLDKLASGSWIYGNFQIWCGHHEKNRGWELLAAARQAMMGHISKVSAELQKSVWRELHAAEGSDWFWWYGDDHHTAQADQFDRLFRGHLINIYSKLDLQVPHELFEPIKTTAKSGLLRKPSKLLNVNTDGRVTDFYEWLGSGEFDLSFDEGSMHSGGGYLGRLFFGYSADGNVYLRLDSERNMVLPEKCTLEIEIEGSKKLIIDLEKGKVTAADGVRACMDKVVEVGIPEKMLFGDLDTVGVIFYLRTDGGINERAPRYNSVKLEKTDEVVNDWMV